jgi:hypothetical protein
VPKDLFELEMGLPGQVSGLSLVLSQEYYLLLWAALEIGFELWFASNQLLRIDSWL